MEIKLRNNYGPNEEILDIILNNRNIKNHNLYKNPTQENINYDNIKNLKEGVQLYLKHMNKKSKTIILVDSDVDGYTSSSEIYQFTRNNFQNVNIDFFVHTSKKPGITDSFKEYLEQNDYKFIIIPDAATNDGERIKELQEKGMDFLIIDHHKLEEKLYTKTACLINNQQDNTNKNYTGAGMVYLFCCAVASTLNISQPTYLMDLTSIGIIADSAVLVDNEIRYLCLNGLKNIENNFIKQICKQKDIVNLTINDVGWKIAPIINAVCRSGALQQRILLFKALNDIHENEKFIVEKRKLNKETRKYEKINIEMNFYEFVLEQCEQCKNQQAKITKAAIKTLESQIISGANVQVFILDSKELQAMTGLVANKMVDICKAPCLIFWDNETEFIGSARGHEKSLDNFKEWCMETKLFSLAQGHNNAFGIKVPKENMDKLKEITKNVTFNKVNRDNIYLVDYIYENGCIIRKHMYDVALNMDLWGKGCEEPLFAVKDLVLCKNDIKLYRNFLRIFSNGVSLVKHFANEDLYNKLVKESLGDKIKVNVVCRFEKNEYNGKIFTQAEIVDIEKINNPIETTTITKQMFDFFA